MLALFWSALPALGCDRAASPPSPDATPDAPVEAAAPPPPTRFAVSDHGFSLALPGGWVQRERTASGADVFRAADGSTQLTVSVFPAAVRMDTAKRDQTLTSLLKDRRESERAIMGARMTMGEPRRREQDGVVSAGYEGLDLDGHQRFATLVLVSAAGAWTLFVESHEPSEPIFRRTVDGVFGSVVVDR